MTARDPVEFVDEYGKIAGNKVITSQNPTLPINFAYEFLKRITGPLAASGNTYDLNTNSSATATIFNYRVPKGKILKFYRINMSLVDGSMNPVDFAGITNGLANGCLLQIVDSDGTVLQHFGTNEVPIKTNADFVPLAGSDTTITELAGDDELPIRFTIAKAGAPMILTEKQNIRWINQDDLSSITQFRMMIQGIYV